jgi:ATP-dependent exoDNAse (exonuclease V) beta subunit
MSARHVMILASAGSGKTYALTNRFVALLAAGAHPERIVALTFTRKAAGEFFDEILNKLARAATDEPFASQLARELELPQLEPVNFLQMLRAVVDAMPRLRLGTLDGFFGRIARAFPLELGLTGDFEVLQEHAAGVERRRVLQRMFVRSAAGLDAAQHEFIEAFKRATFGTEEKRLAARLDAFLDEHHENFLGAPLAALWGDAARVWPDGCFWLGSGEKDLSAAIISLREALARRGLPEKQQARWDLFFAAVTEWTAGAPLPRPIEYILENALAVWSDVRAGSAAIVVERKKIALAADECADLAIIIRHLVSAEFTRRLETTQGIHAVLRAYESIYHTAVRRRGRLTFSDVQRLLLPDRNGDMLARSGVDDDHGRLMIDFRLDAQFDHWLLDEFQDTSFGQWSVLRNLIDEAVQDAAGQRTFFCVGDVKQAIYTWREGDPRLFREIYEHYNRAAPGTIKEQHLVKSWRSSPAIIDMVNAVFGRADALDKLFPGDAAEAWNREWRDHESARPTLTGQAAWLYGADEAERYALTVRLLLEIDPIERGLECAVLTQTNAAATALADYLRREGGIPAIAESDLHIATDNPLGTALLALMKAAAHPGDSLAREHVAMTPLRGILEIENVNTPEALTRRLLAQIHSGGFEATAEFWLRRIEPVIAPDDEFSRLRGRQFVAAAALFDATTSRDVAEFIGFMERHALKGSEMSGVVRVMTIHKSKGLGFDVVVLPDLEGQRIDQRRAGLAIQRGADRAVEWVLDLPPKLFYSQDEILHAHVHRAEAEACYEALSLLYVSLTRAKRGMYLITKPVGKSESRNYPKLLTAALGAEERTIRIGQLSCHGGRSFGDPDWHESVERPSADSARTLAGQREPFQVRSALRVTRRAARRPSAQHTGVIAAAQLFAPDAADAVEFGTTVHALLAEVEWADAGQQFAWGERHLEPRAAAEATACLQSPPLAGIWQRIERAEVWRERGFEIVLDGAWISGVFDRVVLERDSNNRVQWVTVFDFKTDQIAEGDLNDAVRRHAAQLNLYRRVAAVFAEVPVDAVTCELVFTRLQRRVRVPAT